MTSMRAGLAVISIIVLAIHGVVFYNQFFAPWQDVQEEYFKRAAKVSESAAVQATLAGRSPAIEQTIVRSFGPERVDRCMTCHIASDDPRFPRADQPLRTHPPLPPGHKFETFGCTICHDGQGRAVDAEHAHEGRGGLAVAAPAHRADRGQLRAVPHGAGLAARAAGQRGAAPVLRARLLHLPHDLRPVVWIDRPRADGGGAQAAA